MAKTRQLPIYYFDSCLFLSLINAESDRFKLIEAILDDAQKQECEVYTSQLSVAEVAFGEQEKKGRALSANAEKNIEKLWHPDSPVRLIDVHSIIAIEPKAIIRRAMQKGWTKDEDWSIKPSDAIHLATAKIIGAKYFFTYDTRLLKLTQTGLDIRLPFLEQGRLGVNPT
jgi:predicted nucleic acid-binding protein